MYLYLVNSKKLNQAPKEEARRKRKQISPDKLEIKSVSTRWVSTGLTQSLSHSASQTKELAAGLVEDMLPTCIQVTRPSPLMLTWNHYLFWVQLSLGNRSFP